MTNQRPPAGPPSPPTPPTRPSPPTAPTRPARPQLEAVGVVVPAHDEEELIGRCVSTVLASAAALRRTRPDVAVHVVVVLDGCTDGTAAVVARHHAAGVVGLPVSVRCVGSARRLGVAHLAERLDDLDAARVLVVNTDADCVVPASWLADHVDLAHGRDLVQGWVVPDAGDVSAEVMARWRSLNPVGRGSLHGANLSVRLHAYLEAGGFADVAEHEDLLLVRALKVAGFAAVSGTTVVTSGRRRGRVDGGFAGYLRDLDTV